MNTIIIALIVLTLATLVNIFYITVLYHRGLAHGAVQLNPLSRWLISHTGIWVTGIDPKAWVCMHRAHHMYSDTEHDPHSPIQFGVLGVGLGQLRSYETVLRGLIRKNPKFTSLVKDIPFEVSRLNRKKRWLAPYILQYLIAIALGLLTSSWLIGIAYFIGIMSHPVHGWMVNSLAHKFGYRNFETQDHSTNNTFVSLFVAGEGLQNNHHARPKRANFAIKKGELDWGYTLCKIADTFGVIRIAR